MAKKLPATRRIVDIEDDYINAKGTAMAVAELLQLSTKNLTDDPPCRETIFNSAAEIADCLRRIDKAFSDLHHYARQVDFKLKKSKALAESS